MNKRVKISFLSIGLLVLCATLIWLSTTSFVQVRSQTIERDNYDNPYSQIDQRAQAVNGADEAAISELTNAIFRVPLLAYVPNVIARSFKERLVRSELNYRSGRAHGVSEERVVDVVNLLALKFEAPDWARTSQQEVRGLRSLMSRSMPNFISHAPAGQTNSELADVGRGFNLKPMMSPLEAVYVAQSLVEQKMVNESYQLSPAERQDVMKALETLEVNGSVLTPEVRAFVMMDRIHQKVDQRATQRTPKELAFLARKRIAEEGQMVTTQARSYLSGGPSSARQEEMEAVLLRAKAMDLRTRLAFAHQLLDGLSIER